MKITVLDLKPGEEEELIIKCNEITDDIKKLLNRFKQGNEKLSVYKDGCIHLIEPQEIYYFETVEQKVFAYGEEIVYEIKSKLYELEEELPEQDFLRVTKSMILNLNRIKSLSPALGGRFEALLKNGEKIIISRQYVPLLKRKLGL